MVVPHCMREDTASECIGRRGRVSKAFRCQCNLLVGQACAACGEYPVQTPWVHVATGKLAACWLSCKRAAITGCSCVPTLSQPPAALALYPLAHVLQLQPSVFFSLQPVPLTEHCMETSTRARCCACAGRLEDQCNC